MARVPVEVWNIEHAEYLNPQRNAMNIRTAQGRWITLEQTGETREKFQAVEQYAASVEDLEIKPFNWRQVEDEKRFRMIAKEEAEKAAAEHESMQAKMKEMEGEAAKSVTPPTVQNGVVLLNKESSDLPTVNVVVPAVVAPIMELQVTSKTAELNVESIDPQVDMRLVPVEAATNDAQVSVAPTTPEESAHVVVVVEPQSAQLLEAAGLDATKTVTDAIEAAQPELPVKAAEATEVPVAAPKEPEPETIIEVIEEPKAPEVPPVPEVPVDAPTEPPKA